MINMLVPFKKTGRNQSKLLVLAILVMLGGIQPVFAAGPPAESPFSNPFAILMIVIMIILLIVIGVMANILIGTADVSLLKWKKEQAEKKKAAGIKTASIVTAFLLLGTQVWSQDNAAAPQGPSQIINGLSNGAFYIMVSVIFLELVIILGFLFNIRGLLKAQQERETQPEGEAIEYKPVQKEAAWWRKLNRFKPIEQEADIDLGHDYDGIRELDNRLPPWWLWGFYLTILFAVVYLWRFHVSHSAPSSREEYENAVAKADIEIKEYLKQKGESVDENTVTLLTDPTDLAEGKKNFTISCVSCHKDDGGGLVGPNLTDDYWIHGGDIKSIFKTIKYGINAMPQWQSAYSNKQIAQLASYVRSLHGTNPKDGREPQGERYVEEAAPAAPATDSAAAAPAQQVSKLEY